MRWRLLGIAVFAVIIAWFTLINSTPVTVDFLFVKATTNLVFVILLALLLGMCLMAVLWAMRAWQLRRVSKELRREIGRLQQELAEWEARYPEASDDETEDVDNDADDGAADIDEEASDDEGSERIVNGDAHASTTSTHPGQSSSPELDTDEADTAATDTSSPTSDASEADPEHRRGGPSGPSQGGER